jgi:hypothetical protein
MLGIKYELTASTMVMSLYPQSSWDHILQRRFIGALCTRLVVRVGATGTRPGGSRRRVEHVGLVHRVSFAVMAVADLGSELMRLLTSLTPRARFSSSQPSASLYIKKK